MMKLRAKNLLTLEDEKINFNTINILCLYNKGTELNSEWKF